MRPKHPACPHTSPEGTVAPLQGHSGGAPAALALVPFSMGPLPGFLSPSGALLHPDVHLLTPILLPELQAVQKAFLQQAQTVTWNTSKAATEGGGGGGVGGGMPKVISEKAEADSERSPAGDKLAKHDVESKLFWRN